LIPQGEGREQELPKSRVLASFFERLEPLEAILRIVLSQARISALLTFRGRPEHKVLLDFSTEPARVLVDPAAKAADVYVTLEAETMHDILLGRMNPGVAVGRRAMLLRGSPHHLAAFIPLFDFGPLLYREHLRDAGVCGYRRQKARALTQREAFMTTRVFRGDPIPLEHLSTWERVLFSCLNKLSYLVGYLMGLLRYRLLEKMSLFEVLSAMSKGLAAAMPAEEKRRQCAGTGPSGKETG
jgi:hypothetical protein